MKNLRISRSTLTAVITLTTLLLLVGVFGTLNPKQLEQVKFPDWRTPPELDPKGPWPYAPPDDIQDFVNRLDAIAIATVSAISEPIEEVPYQTSATSTRLNFPAPSITVTYYTLDLEQIMLNDGNLSANPRLRQSGIHYAGSPQIGKRYLFGIRANPDGKSYGAPREWNIIPLDRNTIHNIDGTSPNYPSVTNEASLKESIKSALSKRVRLQPEQWPKAQTNENAPARSIHGDPTTSMGLPVSAIYLPPQNIQDLVNRVDAVITGTISAIGNTASDGPYNDSQGVNQLTQAGYPAPVITVTYYTITVDEILLDDGNIASNPILRLGGSPSESLPQVGESFLFALDVNPDRKSYGIIENWNLIPLDGGSIQNFDGVEPGYTGVTDEKSLKSAIQKAVTTRSPSQPPDWPKRPFLVNENAPAETPQPPGGGPDDENAPAGNANN